MELLNALPENRLAAPVLRVALSRKSSVVPAESTVIQIHPLAAYPSARFRLPATNRWVVVDAVDSVCNSGAYACTERRLSCGDLATTLRHHFLKE